MILDNFVQWLVVNTLFPETIHQHNQKDGLKESSELGLYQKSQPVFNTANMGLKFESGLRAKIIHSLGSEYLMERTNTCSIQITTRQKFLQIHMKIKRHKQVSRLLQPDQRQKQNHKRGNLLIRQLSYRCTKENGLTLSHQNHLSQRTMSRKKSDQSC